MKRLLAAVAVGAVAAGVMLPAEPEQYAHPEIVSAPKPPVVKTVTKRVASVKPQRVPPITGAKGLTKRAAALAAYLQKTYPDIKEIGGVRPCDIYREHCRGIALDVIVGSNTALGDRIVADVLGRDGIQYILWKEKYRRPNGLSRWMSDRGSPTQNHFDHAHIRVVG